TSIPFLCFVLATVAVFWLLPSRVQRAWLLVTSLAYAATWGWPVLALLGCLSAATVGIGARVASHGANRRVWLVAGIALHVLAMVLLRHAVWFGPAGAIGLSFYALHAVSYLGAIYQRTLRRPAALDVALYLLYFPKMLAGPVERPGDLIPQFRASRI